MAAPDLTQRMTCFVQKNGTDDAGYNAVGHPESRLTIAAALADLAANYPAASSTFYHIVAVGPGTYDEAGITLPPWTFINGSCDGEGRPSTIIRTSADIRLDTAWIANSTQRGGLQNLTIRALSGTPALDLTMPVPSSGNPTRQVILQNVIHSLTSELFEATSTADSLKKLGCAQDGANTDTFLQTGGTAQYNNQTSNAKVTIKDKASFAASADIQGLFLGAGANLTCNSVAAAGCTVRITSSAVQSLVLSQTAPGVLAVSADAISLPVRANVSVTGTATVAANLSYLSDAAGDGYTPTTAGNWSPVPTTVQQALDTLAVAAGGGGNTFVFIVRTGARSLAAWGTAGVAINDTANTFTDTTSAGAVAGVTAFRSFGIPTISNATAVYADLANLYIAGAPATTGGATATNVWSLYVAAGNVRLTSGGLYLGAATPGNISGSAGSLTLAAAGTNQSITFTASGTGNIVIGANNQFIAGLKSDSTVGRILGVSSGNAVQLGDLQNNINGAVEVYIAGGIKGKWAATTGNLLLGGLTTDGTGVLQFSAGTTTAGGIGFSTDTFFYRLGAGILGISSTGTTAKMNFVNSGISAAGANITLGSTTMTIANTEAGSILLATNGSTGLTVSSAQLIRFNAYGAGALSTDASGNITATSDGRLKKVIRPFTRGLGEVLALKPTVYRWKKESGLDTENDYSGFIAQDVQAVIPEAIGKGRNGQLTFNDRPVTAALVNAVKELNLRIVKIESEKS